MIIRSFYYTVSLNENEDSPKSGSIIEDIEVQKNGGILSMLRENHNIVYIISVVENELEYTTNDMIRIKRGYIENIQTLTPSLLDSIIETTGENIENSNNGKNLIIWAYHNKFRSILIEYLLKYPYLCKYVESMIHHFIDKSDYNMIAIDYIKRYNYDITKDNHLLFTQAAMVKNIGLCEILLEEFNAMIPEHIYNLYMKFGKKKYQHMWKLFKNYKDRVVMS